MQEMQEMQEEYEKNIKQRKVKNKIKNYFIEEYKDELNKEYKDEWNKEYIEKTLNDISYLYSDMLYEKDLFNIFKTVSIYEEHIVYKQMKGQNTYDLRKEFLKSLLNIIIHFNEKYNGGVVYENLEIKNKIMIVSIIRKTQSIINGEQAFEQLINIDKVYLPLSDIIIELKKIIKLI